MKSLIQNKKYFIDQINSSKAYQFICMYHYSHIGFKRASLNLGIYRNDTNELVGVLQWGCSANVNIKLDRYVKEPITTADYLELNRFAMADSEGRNSESQAISLGIKWIKQNRPDIRLLVSYSGRVEGNYGYIYQATNWEYLGYFISNGFWKLDGGEKHQITLSLEYKKNKDNYTNMKDYLCATYHDVRQYDSKQFIYIKRLDKKLTPATALLPYPKPNTEYPIQTKEIIYKQDIDYISPPCPQIKQFYYTPNEQLFTRECLKRRGEIIDNEYLIYDKSGKFVEKYNNISEICTKYKGYSQSSISNAIKTGKRYKDYYFRKIPCNETIKPSIDVNIICWIDGIAFYKQSEIVKYTGVTRQAVSSCVKRKGKAIGGKKIIWNESQD